MSASADPPGRKEPPGNLLGPVSFVPFFSGKRKGLCLKDYVSIIVFKKGPVFTRPFVIHEMKETTYFLCEAQNLDRPEALFLHLFPSLVCAAHLTFLGAHFDFVEHPHPAIGSSFLRFEKIKCFHKYSIRLSDKRGKGRRITGC